MAYGRRLALALTITAFTCSLNVLSSSKSSAPPFGPSPSFVCVYHSSSFSTISSNSVDAEIRWALQSRSTGSVLRVFLFN